jgi:hypothetical protein
MSAFQNRNHPPLSGSAGDFKQDSGQILDIDVRKAKLPQRI